MALDNVKDVYGQRAHKEAFGYPKGRFAKFLDGRILRNLESGSLRGFLATLGFVTNNTGALVVRNPARGRALYIPWALVGKSRGYRFNAEVSWQLWANNSMCASAEAGQFVANIGVYVPPESQVTFYMRVVNSEAPTIYTTFSVQWLEFDSDPADIWEFGSGANTPNPLIGGIVWP